MKPAAFLLSCALLGTVEAKELRIATFNASLFRPGAGELIADTAKKDQEQLLAVAAIIRKIDADVLLLNEFDYDEKEQALGNFQTNYLHDLYPHHFSAPVNTGVPSGMDLNHDGDTTDPQDAFGYGTHPGQYGMVLFSKFPLQTDSIRTFQKLLWRDLPGNMIPKSYYTAGQVDKLRLSSKSHWDVPITVENQTVHVLCSHRHSTSDGLSTSPTPRRSIGTAAATTMKSASGRNTSAMPTHDGSLMTKSTPAVSRLDRDSWFSVI